MTWTKGVAEAAAEAAEAEVLMMQEVAELILLRFETRSLCQRLGEVGMELWTRQKTRRWEAQRRKAGR